MPRPPNIFSRAPQSQLAVKLSATDQASAASLQLIEEGRRLENLSWRLWNRETFCCAPGEANATTPAISISQRSPERRYTADVPDLSGSLDALADEKAIESDNKPSASTSRPRLETRLWFQPESWQGETYHSR
ncbi:hypothetical protein VE03_10708 [Pseudogymnoascus sp. 23342-1-I1]|nr:hypothetical protein VE03_10708 [Pseudogymnoascus sp. 23342-1-I1]